MVGQAWRRLSQGGFPLSAQGLLLGKGLLLLTHLAVARFAGALATQEVEAGTAGGAVIEGVSAEGSAGGRGGCWLGAVVRRAVAGCECRHGKRAASQI